MNYEENPDSFAAMIEAYVIDCAGKNDIVTIPGCALFLGVTKREIERLGATEGLAPGYELLKTYVEQYALRRLYSTQPTGGIFALKQMGYSDTPTKVTADVHVHLSAQDAKL